MKFEIKHIEVIDEFDSESSLPQIVQCHVEIGDVGLPGADIFFIDVCNASWAEAHFQDSSSIDPSLLVLEKINEKDIKLQLEERLLSRDYNSIHAFADQARPLLRWEFS
jgi:hypothetical protein